MKNNNYPNWLVPIDIAEKLKEIGFDSLEIFVDKSGSWYRGDEIFDYDNDGDFITYSVKEAYLNGDKDFMPTYSYEQVFEWFREKGLHCYIEATRTSIEYIDKNLKSPTIFNGKPFKRHNMIEPITLYSYYTGTNAKGSCMFELDNFNLTINTKRFKTYEECRYAMVIDLIEEYKKYHMTNEESN